MNDRKVNFGNGLMCESVWEEQRKKEDSILQKKKKKKKKLEQKNFLSDDPRRERECEKRIQFAHAKKTSNDLWSATNKYKSFMIR